MFIEMYRMADARQLIFTTIILCVLSVTESCPSYCQCSRYPNVVNCTGLKSFEPLATGSFPGDTTILTIRNGMFNKLSGIDTMQIPAKDLRTLEISASQLSEIHDKAFNSLISLRELKLTNNQLQTIQPNAFAGLSNLETLDISGNQLSFLSSANLLHPLPYLTNADFSGNQLSSFPSGFFQQQTRLQTLNIAGNNIENLPGSVFKGVRDLRRLYASRCKIRTMESDFFSAIENVDTLDLSFNQIGALPNAQSMGTLRMLRNLTLTGNRITFLLEDQFQGLNLNVLDLSRNEISTVNPNTFKYLNGLRNLDLSHNRLTSLTSYIFQPIVSSLYSLNLSNNKQLNTLPNTIFDGMDKLSDIDLSFCALTKLSDYHFLYMNSLQSVDISNNQLGYIPQAFFDRTYTNSMLMVRIDNNRWHCDCLIKPLRNWLQLSHTANMLYCQSSANSMNNFKMSCSMPQCYTPANLMNEQIALLSDREIKDCENFEALTSKETKVIIGAAIGGAVGVIAIVAIIAIIVCLCRRHKRGDPLLCGEKIEHEYPPRRKGRDKTVAHRPKKHSKKDKYYIEKKDRRNNDPEIGSLNESDKSFVVRNYFHSMNPDPEEISEGTHSMTRKDSVESLSQSGYGYGDRRGSRGSRESSQYSISAGYKIESAV